MFIQIRFADGGAHIFDMDELSEHDVKGTRTAGGDMVTIDGRAVASAEPWQPRLDSDGAPRLWGRTSAFLKLR